MSQPRSIAGLTRWGSPGACGGLGALAGVVPEEPDQSGDRPEVRGGGSGLPVEDSRPIDLDPQRSLALEESEVQAALSDMIAERQEFRRVRATNGFLAFQPQITKWHRRGARAGFSGTRGSRASAPRTSSNSTGVA